VRDLRAERAVSASSRSVDRFAGSRPTCHRPVIGLPAPVEGTVAPLHWIGSENFHPEHSHFLA
jgi:hypothetical protein